MLYCRPGRNRSSYVPLDHEIAGNLVRALSSYDSVLKGHYTDFVDNPALYPVYGVGAANIGPEFTAVECQALRDLEKKEQQFHKQRAIERTIETPSQMGLALQNAVVESGRWKKWLSKDEIGKSFSELSQDRQDWLVQTGCRYIWTQDSVHQARKQLYVNLEKQGLDAHKIVIDRISDSIFGYYKAFNLIGLTSEIERNL